MRIKRLASNSELENELIEYLGWEQENQSPYYLCLQSSGLHSVHWDTGHSWRGGDTGLPSQFTEGAGTGPGHFCHPQCLDCPPSQEIWGIRVCPVHTRPALGWVQPRKKVQCWIVQYWDSFVLFCFFNFGIHVIKTGNKTNKQKNTLGWTKKLKHSNQLLSEYRATGSAHTFYFVSKKRKGSAWMFPFLSRPHVRLILYENSCWQVA